MNDRQWLEARVGQLISAYADQAPTDIDPVALARSVGAGQVAKGRIRFELWPRHYGLVPGLLIVAAVLGVLVTGAVTAGSQLFRRPPTDALPGRNVIAPFVGLAPASAEPSQPERGELVLSFEARLTDLAIMHVRTFVYADGRFIWTSEGGLKGRAPADAVVEQRLTSDGIGLMRALAASGSHVVGPAVANADGAAGPGVLWGALTLVENGQKLDVAWTDGDLPARLADPLAWLPVSAWADPAIHGFVPARYAVCTWADGGSSLPNGAPATSALPVSLRALVLDAGPRMEEATLDCHAVPLDSARSIAGALEAAGHRRDADYVGQRYDFWTEAGDRAITIDISPIVPSGEIVCNCG